MQPVMVRMPPDMYDAVKREADEQDRTVGATIRRAVRQYLDAQRTNDRPDAR